VKRTIDVRSIDELNSLLDKLEAEGFDCFRGQAHCWPVRASLFRIAEDKREAAEERAAQFMAWAHEHPRLQRYFESPEEIVGIAQHYGFPTPFVDLTTSRDVALYFALATKLADFTPVLFSWKSDSLEPYARIRRVGIPNLWRLDAQRGLFAEMLPTNDLSEVGECCELRLVGEAWASVPILPATDVMPVRKSVLETILDTFFYARVIDDLVTTKLSGMKVLQRRWHSYVGAFRNREIKPPEDSHAQLEGEWFVDHHQPYSGAPPTELIVDSGPCAQMETAVRRCCEEYPSVGARPQFKVELFESQPHNVEAAAVLNNVFDGIVSHPYSVELRCDCLLNTIALIAAIASAPPLQPPAAPEERRLDALTFSFAERFGELVDVGFASWGGFHTCGWVARADIEACLRKADSDEI
jgi:hypothetical protein